MRKDTTNCRLVASLWKIICQFGEGDLPFALKSNAKTHQTHMRMASLNKSLRFNPVVAIFMVLCCGSACTHYYYAPNTLNTPYLQDKHDATARLALGSGNEYQATEVQAVYSPIRHGALMVNYFNAQGNKSNTDSGKGHGQMLEGAIGAYLPFAEVFSASLFAGYGRGQVHNEYVMSSSSGGTVYRPSDLKFERHFIQPSVVFRGHRRFTASLGFRLCRLHYVSGQIDASIPTEDLKAIMLIEEKSPIWLPEASYGIGLHIRPVTASLTLTRSVSPDPNLRLNPSNLAFSLAIDIHQLLKLGRDTKE